MKKTVAVIVNPISGTKNKEGIKRIINETLDTEKLDVLDYLQINYLIQVKKIK